MARLDVYQSMWAMEFNRPDDFEWSLEEKIQKIAEAGFKGLSFDIGYHDYHVIEKAMPLLQEHQLGLVYNAFVKNSEHYAEILEFANRQPVRPSFIAIVGQVEPWDLNDVAETTRAWKTLGEQAGIQTLIEVHRNCMTNDLMFTLQLMEKVPDLFMVADLSHTLVNQEWYPPLSEQAQKRLSQLLVRTEAFHGRVATREQMQVPFLLPQYSPWFELFQQWWKQGFELWIQRHGKTSNDVCIFLSELGPPVYAITGKDGYELSDRWQEALVLKETAHKLWCKAIEACEVTEA